MLTKLTSEFKVSIPKDIVNSMSLNQEDQFEVIEYNGKIILVPIAIYPEHVIKNLKFELEEIKKFIKNCNQPVFDSIISLLEELDK